ncbi:SBBP repeat-containing protein [Edaphobacter bradus]|uniref:SBBP repeat-containing protein n=1 Tax=Edaphobacter bradus TaxID=2259016 RepID=UPI0021E07727|nr:SBBP repeat-containing protein [Edaphobacter bradus]
MMKRLPLLCFSLAALLGLVTLPITAQTAQQLAFAGLLASGHQGQFNAVQSDASGNLYLLLDQKDGVRLLKTDPTTTNVLAQAHLGAQGDIGLALCLDPSGNVYITGTTTSGALAGTSGVTFPTRADTSTNSFIAKFDPSLNPLFVTFAGSGRTAVSAIAATSDAVFITGSTFASTLPVTSSAIIQSPASGSFQNGFVEKFNSSGTTLLYATYLTGLNGDTAPAAIAADSSDSAYIAGYTTSSGYPTLSAVVPSILSATSGFLTKLTPAGDGITFSTFIPGEGITSLAIDSSTQTLLLTGSIALGQFPVATVTTPLAGDHLSEPHPYGTRRQQGSHFDPPRTRHAIDNYTSVFRQRMGCSPSEYASASLPRAVHHRQLCAASHRLLKRHRPGCALRRAPDNQPNLRLRARHRHLHRRRLQRPAHRCRQRRPHDKLQPARQSDLRSLPKQLTHSRAPLDAPRRRPCSGLLQRQSLRRVRGLSCQAQPHQRTSSGSLRRRFSQRHPPQSRNGHRHRSSSLRDRLHARSQLPRATSWRIRVQYRLTGSGP